MNRVTSLLLGAFFLFALGVESFGQASTLSADLQTQYNKKKLSIQVSSTTTVASRANGIAVPLGNVVFSGAAGNSTMSTTTDWVGYRGFDRVSEEEFFRIAGYDEQVAKIREVKEWYSSRAESAISGSLWILGGGLTLGLVAILQNDTMYNIGIGVPAAIVSGAGAMVGVISLGMPTLKNGGRFRNVYTRTRRRRRWMTTIGDFC